MAAKPASDAALRKALIDYVADRPASVAIERNRETHEFGHLDHGFAAHVDGFVAAFQRLVDRSRAPHETRLEQKVDALLERVVHTRGEEESHRTRTDPGTGEILSRTMLTMRLRGTRFSKDGDFSRETLEAISRAGGVIVD